QRFDGEEKRKESHRRRDEEPRDVAGRRGKLLQVAPSSIVTRHQRRYSRSKNFLSTFAWMQRVKLLRAPRCVRPSLDGNILTHALRLSTCPFLSGSCRATRRCRVRRYLTARSIEPSP